MPYSITDKCSGCGACVRICPADAISGEKKGLHIVDAGICIECGACGRVCPQECILDSSGTACSRSKKSEWPKPRFDLKKCLACIACIEACPKGSLGFSGRIASAAPQNYPCIDHDKACMGCGFCAEACPVDAVTMLCEPVETSS
ncbi:MAG: 4Fe-4S binding protein [Syntrophales bacterium]|nr:4Fe-4S binding protein [Syntrophales bacterium]